jgi:hypothetical protein
MEIGEIVEVGDRKVVVTPRKDPAPTRAPEKTPERVKEPS